MVDVIEKTDLFFTRTGKVKNILEHSCNRSVKNSETQE